MDGPILVWGAGAMGGTIGAHLARAGHPVRFVDTARDHVEALREHGLRITGPVAEFRVEADARLPGDLQGEYDTILLAVKGHHTAQAVRQLAPHLDEEGAVVSVQNGLCEEEIASVVGRRRTVGCFVNFGADYLEPGVVHYGGRGSVVVGELDGRPSLRAGRLLELFQDFDDRARLSDNIYGYLWSKLAYASMLFATALTDLGIADALDHEPTRDVYEALAREVVAVARAAGVRLERFDGFDPAAFAPDAGAEAADRSLDDLVAHNRTSAKSHSGIWRDLAVRRRRTEVDAQVGVVVERARELDVPAPLNARLVRMIHEVETGERDRGLRNLAELREAG